MYMYQEWKEASIINKFSISTVPKNNLQLAMKWKTKSQAPFDFLGVPGWILEQNKKWNTDSII